MTLQAIPPRHPSGPRSLLRLVHDRNPFYLLSALSMFVGFRVVLAALDAAAGDWRTLLKLIVTMQLYEGAIIALALYLIVRRGLRRDGWILLGVQSLFLVDLTNLNAELFTALPRLGAVVSAACFALAVLKIGVVLRVLGLRVTPGTAFYVAAQLAFLLGLPGVFQLMRSTSAAVSPMQVYAVWWAAGALLALGAILVRRDHGSDGHPMATLPMRLFVLLPMASLLIHLASENRVYWVHFQPANVAPLLLAAVVAVNRGRRHPLQLQWSMALAATAVLLSIVPDVDHAAMSASPHGLAISPLRLTVTAAAVAGAMLAVRHRSWATGIVSVGYLVLAALGTSVPDIARRLERAAEGLAGTAARAVPRSGLEWGYVAIFGAFVLLGVGATLSLHGGGIPPPTEEPISPAPEPA